ncbi:MAG: DUF6455 family protein [Pseudomonadota bacterium]|nr:DUF6455 family protein [Pseudomonadota bacterium]
MSTFETIIIIFFLLLATFVIIGLSLSIMHSSQQGESYYQGLISRIKLLRMHKMLQAMGIDTSHYARRHPINEIEMHLKRCQQCSNTEQCDNELDSGKLVDAEKYCPNNADMLATPTKHPESF